MPDLEKKILDYLSRPAYKPVKAKVLAKKVGVTKKDMSEFRETLDQLKASNKVREGRNGLLRPRTTPGLVAGVIKRISSGAGFLIPHDKPAGQTGGDIFISERDLHDAHTGDEVLVRLLKRRRRGGQRCGRVEEVIERATNTFVGTYFEQDGEGLVQVDGKTFLEPISVGDPGAKGASPGDKVVVEMLRFPSHYRVGEGVLTKVLGASGEPGVDLQSIIHEFGLPEEFPEEVLEEARIQADNFDESDLEGRLDLTKETIITIDPKDARDFDDAISLSRSKEGHWHLGVHIADVSHFVQPGTDLDQEAIKRGNSVYLPGQVIPMLPEVISNGLASLQKGKVRFTKSVFIEMTAEGIPVQTRFYNSAIRVARRFAYEDVLPIIQDPEKPHPRVSAKVRSLLVEMHELAMILRARRFAGGALELDIPEVKIDFNKQGRVSGAHTVENDESHQMIEEFMLAANTAVAQELSDRGVSYLHRAHGEPDIVKLKTFADFVSVLGYRLKNYQSRPELQSLLARVQGESTEYAVNYALLRSMKPAEYTGEEIGHYALAVEEYCHFTSPIRRYPDLAVHRLFDAVVQAKKRPKVMNELELAKLGKHCSDTERRAAAAERELTKIKLLTYMADRVGEEMDATITGVEQFGLFCQGVEIPAEGLVHISTLMAEDHFYFDSEALSLVGRRSGRQYRLGDRVRVSIVRVDIDRRELDLRLVPQKGGRKRKSQKRRTSSSSNSKRKKSQSRGKNSASGSSAGRSKKRGSKGKQGRRKKK